MSVRPSRSACDRVKTSGKSVMHARTLPVRAACLRSSTGRDPARSPYSRSDGDLGPIAAQITVRREHARRGST